MPSPSGICEKNDKLQLLLCHPLGLKRNNQFRRSPMRNALLKFFLVSVVVAFFGLPAFGQVNPTGSISGTVEDQHGAVVANASVTAKNKATGETKTATTSDSGSYSIPAIPAGVYVVTIENKGFKKTQITDVKVDVGTPATVNATLEVGATE